MNLSRRARRSASSVTYYLQKTYWKIVTMKPSTYLLAGIVIGASIFLLGGGVYDILEQPIIAFVYNSRIIPYYPQSLNDQLLGESIASMVLYSIGIIGLVLMYKSTKYAYSPREAFTWLMIGGILFLVGWAIIEFYLFPGTIQSLE